MKRSIKQGIYYHSATCICIMDAQRFRLWLIDMNIMSVEKTLIGYAGGTSIGLYWRVVVSVLLLVLLISEVTYISK